VIYFSAFLASFLFVGLKAMQQINVVRDQKLRIMPTSIGLAACEFYLVGYMVKLGPSVPSVAAVGIGAGLGCLLAMKLNRRK